jgi:S-adenosylmethionine hydrolase
LSGRVITLTTDFGVGSPYLASMKGVMLTLNPDAVIVDVTHGIAPQDVREAALVIEDVTRRFPADSIHVVVVDPGVGTDRELIYAHLGHGHYIAPDNGVLSFLARRTPPTMVRSLKEPSYWLPEISATFHGRDVMAPVAAHLSLGLDPRELGPEKDDLVMLPWKAPLRRTREVRGEIVWVDGFGNVVSNITARDLADVPQDGPLRITCCEHVVDALSRTYGDHPKGALIALIGSSGYLELATVGGSASRTLNAVIGDRVILGW